MRISVAVALFLAFFAPSQQALAAQCDSNVLIVIDKSCSMDDPVGGGDPRTKWVVAVEALNALLAEYQGDLRFGLTLFPDQTGENCAQEDIPLPIAPDNETPISDLLAATVPDGPCVTNIDTAVAEAWEDPAFLECDLAVAPVDCLRRGFVLLVTDGMQSNSCGGTAADVITEATITDLYDAGILTYVVGFGGAVDADSLSGFAIAGGTARDEKPEYYQADDAAQLEQVLVDIGGAIGANPKFGCPGLPCPDGRCFEAKTSCNAETGLCESPKPPMPDAGLLDGASDGGNGDGAADGGITVSAVSEDGCGCALGAVAASGARHDYPATFWLALVGLTAFLAAVLYWRRRK